MEKLSRTLLRALWLGIIPALLTGVVLRYCMPPQAVGPSAMRLFSRAVYEYPLPAAVALFALLAGVARYWRYHLPGGQFLSLLPAGLADRVPRKDLPEYDAACEAQNLLRDAARRQKDDAALSTALGTLESALSSGDVAAVEAATESALSAAEPFVKKRHQREAFGVALGIALAAVLALWVRGSVVETYRILSGSMLPALMLDDQIVVNKAAYGLDVPFGPRVAAREPRRGDVVVFERTSHRDGHQRVVKRVIGLPGDRISMRGSVPVINDWLVPMCEVGAYLYMGADGVSRGRLFVEYLGDNAHLIMYSATPPRFAQTYEVKPGEVFVLGDNRGDSGDSRTWNEGFGGGLPLGDIIGRADFMAIRRHHDGTTDYRRLFERLRPNVDSAATEWGELTTRLDECLAKWPAETTPPAPGAASNPAAQAKNGAHPALGPGLGALASTGTPEQHEEETLNLDNATESVDDAE